MYGLTLTSAPASEPLSVSELKGWLRQDGEDDDALITSLGSAARDMAEKLTGRAFVTQSWLLSMDGFPWPGGWQYLQNPIVWPDPHTIRMPKAPLVSVSGVQYYDLGNVLRTLDPATYDVDAATDPGRISLSMNMTWPVTRLRPGAVRIAFTAGYGDASAVPDIAKQAIRFAVSFWYENRGDDAGVMADLPPASKALLAALWNGEMEYGTP